MQPPPPPQTTQFDLYTPVIAVPQVSGLYRSQLCLTLSFKVLYCWLSLLWAMQSPAFHHCPICTPMWSFAVPFLGLGQSWTMPSACFDLCRQIHSFVL